MIEAALTEIQRLPTSGARAAAPFVIGGRRWLAVPQLAYDKAGSPPGINGGSSDTEVLLFREGPGGFALTGALPTGGGEDAEAFTIDGRLFIAIASIRKGDGPYEFATTSPIYRFEEGGFRLFQEIETYAAKQIRHFEADGAHYLGIAQNMPPASAPSCILKWDGTRFVPEQQLESVAGYNIEVFVVDGVTFLAHADHAAPSRLYRLERGRFVEHQELLPSGGRAFLPLADASGRYLAVARIDGDSILLRWDGYRFSAATPMPGGPGGREFAMVRTERATYVVRVDFIHGTPSDPEPELLSHVYRFHSGALETVARFPTTGGTDVAVLPGRSRELAVSNGLAAPSQPGRTFAADSVIYRLDETVQEDKA